MKLLIHNGIWLLILILASGYAICLLSKIAISQVIKYFEWVLDALDNKAKEVIAEVR